MKSFEPCDLFRLSGIEEDVAKGHHQDGLQLPHDLVGHRRGLANEPVDADVRADGQEVAEADPIEIASQLKNNGAVYGKFYIVCSCTSEDIVWSVHITFVSIIYGIYIWYVLV